MPNDLTGATAVTIDAPTNSVAMSQQDLAPLLPVPDAAASSAPVGSSTAFRNVERCQRCPVRHAVELQSLNLGLV